MSTFNSLNTGIRGLLAQQRAMEVTGQNIVNVNTPGYSRQRVILEADALKSDATFHTGNRQILGGVTATDITRIKDAFIEANRAAAGGRSQALTAQADVLGRVQEMFAEPSDTGLQSTLDQFYSSWHELSLNPSDGAAGSVVLQKGEAVAERVRSIATAVGVEWNASRNALRDVVNQTNEAAKNLARVNGQIFDAQVSGQPHNELLVQRDQLVRSLADLVGASATPIDDGVVSVSVNGVNIVSGTTAQTFTLAGAGDITQATADPPRIMWGTIAVPVASGEAAGRLAVMRGQLPTMAADLDGVANALRTAVNSVHGSGFTLDGTPGGDFFSGTGAADLRVVPTSPAGLAMTSVAGVIDGVTALKIGDLGNDVTARDVLGGAEGPSALWKKLTTGVGVELQSLQNAKNVQDTVVAAADNAVASDSGVNLDEEMTNLLQYQRAYQASARVITVADELIDTLINRTGTVGR